MSNYKEKKGALNMKKKRSLRREIITLLIIAIIIPVAIVATYSYYSSKNQYHKVYDTTSMDNLNRTSELITGIIKNNSESINMLSEDPNARNMIVGQSESEPWLYKTLEAYMASHKDITGVYLGLNNGKMFLAPAQTLPADYNPRTRPWYKKAIENDGQVVISDPYEDSAENNKGQFIVTIAKTVKDVKSGQTIGVVGLDIKLAYLSQIVANIKIGDTGYVAILDNTGKIIAHKDAKLLGKTSKDQPWVQAVMNSNKTDLKEKIGSETYNISAMENKDTKWKIVAFGAEKEIVNKVNGVRNITLLISIISLIFAILLGYLLVGKISKSISKLIKVLDKVKTGDFTEGIKDDPKSSVEVNAIAEAANSMIENSVLVLTNVMETTKHVREATEGLAAITEESNAVGEEVAKAVQQIAAGATEQASSLEDSAKITSKLGDEVNRSIEDSKKMIAASNEVKQCTVDGIRVIENLKVTFGETSIANKQLAEDIQVLAENSNKISAITDTLKTITEQTNLLALNASIEAARAGEAGRGFAVVAEEVRKLAEQSSESASEINKVIIDIKQSVNEVHARITQTTSLNEKTRESVEVTNSSFEKIEKATHMLEESVDNVTKSLSNINKDKETVVSKISEVALLAQETAATTEEVSASSEEQAAGLQEVVASAEKLSGLAYELEELVGRFKISR